MDLRPQAWGRPRDDVYGPYDASYLQTTGPKNATQTPIVTGTSVIALKFKDGVVIAADNLASYGSLARFNDVKRLRVFANTSVIGFGGDVSDMQYLERHLNELAIDEAYDHPAVDPSHGSSGAEAVAEGEEETTSATGTSRAGTLNAANLHKYMSKLLYARRNKFDPLWNAVLIAGLDSDGKPYLGSADLRGTAFTSPSLATGFGAALAQPIMRKFAATEEDAAKLSKDEAVKIVRECMKVLFYRDARSWDGYSLAVVTAQGVELSEKEKLEDQSWAFADRIKGYGTQIV